MIIQGSVMASLKKQCKMWSLSTSHLDQRAFGLDWFISLPSFSYSECKGQQLPQWIVWVTLHFWLWPYEHFVCLLSLIYCAWYLVSIALKWFLWQLSFFMSSHSMPSLSCPDQHKHWDQDFHRQGLPWSPFTQQACPVPGALSSVSSAFP